MMNLAKIMIIMNGQLADLAKNRRHGAAWSGINKSSKDLLTDEITLYHRGTIPLFYKTLVGSLWPGAKSVKSSQVERKVVLRDIYPYIRDVGFEFVETYQDPNSLVDANVQLITQVTSPNTFRLQVFIKEPYTATGIVNKANYKLISKLKPENNIFVSSTVTAVSESDALEKLLQNFPKFLIYSYSQQFSLTPRSRSGLLLPEEFPIMLAFFHLSNVVRYDPLRLRQLFDSPSVSLLEILARHATFRFLILFWSYVHQKCFFVETR